MSIAPIRPFIATTETLRRLWERFDANRGQFGDELPKDPFGFIAWLDPTTTCIFDVGDPADFCGAFVFTGIDRGEQAWAHVFIWRRDAYPHADLIAAARVACMAVIQGFGLVRINGLTPKTHLHAKIFAERVGFKIEGTLRKACSVGGMREDAWISGLLPEDLVTIPNPPEVRDTIEVTPVEVSG